ncbi:MAG: hypothetical protein J5I98_20765 [Phaeodactylibacter sp.]|nr:hypothetical protein [Phaeodactylibacter sp.]
MAKGKGNGNGKNRNYWRNKIKNERQQPKARFKGRLRSKGESRIRSKSSPPAKGKKWADKITSERRAPVKVSPRGKKWAKEVKNQRKPSAKIQVKKSPVPATKNVIKPAKANRAFKPRQTPVAKPLQARRAAPIKNKITPVRRISQPVVNKNAVNLLKQRQAVVKAPSRNANPKKAAPKAPKLRSAALKNQPAKAPMKAKVAPSKGVAKLKSAAVKNQPVKAPAQSKATPSKGASMLKQSAGKIANQPKPVKRVKQPVIRRGR